jgi:hypothetical protein
VAEETYHILVEADDEAAAGQGAQSLSNELGQVSGVLDATRSKESDSTMDLGATIAVIATSSAAAAVARGIADWLRRRRGTSLKIYRDPRSGSIKAEIENIDPAVALRIVELIRGA